MDYIIGQNSSARNASRDAGPGLRAPHAPAVPDAHPQTGGGASDADIIIDGDQNNFMADVIEASRQVPVLVDFWATWCGPCKTLTPALEKVVRAAGGRIRLVKIDIDANRALVSQLAQIGLPMQSVPTVAAFWQGQILDVFQGALPESELKRFVEVLLKQAGGSMPSADLLAEAKLAIEDGRVEDGAALFSAVLDQDGESPEAWGGLARALLAMGRDEDALGVLDQVPAKIAEHVEISGARSAIALAAEGRKLADAVGGLEARLAADPNDHAARYELATALNAANRRSEAVDALLEILKRDRSWNQDAARLQLIRFFESWGFDEPATLAGRRRMSALLFS
ncbi:co-chaperone YbbN [Acetobacteraceae bacterium KSS8]|uniref:Co-chaperone YbbN n=1 Tax=Endosaccharibacter trunci TaxID=2812733 RepID=A0ABT1W521_9PROT|nr:co-chaperone YbbN [Acetobacteraceae bacterium KSS8]